MDPEKQYQDKLESRLKNIGVWYNFVEKPQSTVHTADAAAVTGIPLHKISKNLMAQTNEGDYVALIVPGDRNVNYDEVKKALGITNIKLVPFDRAHEISGYPPGGTPSIGYDDKVEKVILDTELMEFETFFCGGGSTKMLLEVKRDDVIRVNNATVYKISKPKG